MTPLRLPDTSKARDLLGWMPLVTLEDGLAKTIRDLQANKGVKRIIGGYEV
jgi:nucleoside-diphosphate-sugar epimerase